MPASASLCEDFADHFRSKIDSVRVNIIKGQKSLFIGNVGLILPEEALDSFDLVEAATLGRVFSQVNPTTCFLDPIPTSLFKSFYGSFESEILNIMNSSLQTGIFPAAFKMAVVKQLLKKTNLDPSVFNNYRPVSNLPFLSKVLEKLVFIQLNEFLLQNNIFEINQSGFRTNHSTETALLKIVNDLRCAMDSGQISVLVLLDLSAAFDTVDHLILVNRLKSLGLSGTVLKWFESYLMERSFMVSMDTYFSGVHEINCGVPQGSILGPLLFNIYMLPLGNVIRSHNISFHSYADDTQLYIAMSPDDTRPIEALFNCILDVKLWMANNFLQLNQEKTEILVIGPEAKREKQFLKLQELSLSHSEAVRNLGVIFDSKLTFIPHIKQVVKTGFYHLKNLARVRPLLSLANMEMLMHAFIMSKVDYCNALLAGLPKTNIRNLQLLQNSAARVLTKTRRRAHITPILKSLHWLPICFRIDFKILLTAFKCLNGLAPSYLSDLLVRYEPSRTLRSSGTGLLTIPTVKTKTYGEASFQHYGPRLWNSLPEGLRAAESIDTFKKRLKAHLFNLAFS
uniref:Reverse transcriptase domain-containing protein n=1 Tax=Oryzias latipes TaxID=8090 RepID=A0A3P9M6K8_ORYLA